MEQGKEERAGRRSNEAGDLDEITLYLPNGRTNSAEEWGGDIEQKK